PPRTESKTIYVAIDAPTGATGSATLTLEIEAVGAPVPLTGHQYTWTLDLRDPTSTSVQTVSFPLRQQPTNLGSLIQALIAEAYDANNVKVTAHFSDSIQSLLMASTDLKREPSRELLEHLLWRGLLLFHAPDAGSPERRQELSQILSEVISFQSPDGSF